MSARSCARSASRLLAFYGQHEHRKLTLASAQLEILDAFCGERAPGPRARRFERRLAAARAARSASWRSCATGSARASATSTCSSSRSPRSRRSRRAPRRRGELRARAQPPGGGRDAADGGRGGVRRRSTPRSGGAAEGARCASRPRRRARSRPRGNDPTLDALAARAQARRLRGAGPRAPSCAPT